MQQTSYNLKLRINLQTALLEAYDTLFCLFFFYYKAILKVNGEKIKTHMNLYLMFSLEKNLASVNS